MKIRYVIIDLQDYRGDIEHDNLGLEEGKLLKPKESLAKFKEIWEEGVKYGVMDGSDRFSDDGFEELKKTL